MFPIYPMEVSAGFLWASETIWTHYHHQVLPLVDHWLPWSPKDSFNKFNTMPIDKSSLGIMGDSGTAGQELLDDSPVTDLERKCRVIRTCVLEEIFSLQEALEAYQVTPQAYADYLDHKRD